MDDVRDYLKRVATRLDNAGHGEKSGILIQATGHLGWTRDKLYRELKHQVGWNSGRKTRRDKGATRADLDVVMTMATMQKAATRKNGKQTLHTPTNVSILSANGMHAGVSPSRINALMRQRKLNPKAQKVATPATSMRSLHPNHVHQVDPSLCLVYYLGGKQYIIEDDQFYKNKLDKVAEIKFKCWRYVLADHASNTIINRYYAAHGENTENLFDFLMYAWGRVDGRPFHGVPKLLIWDKGSANASATIKNMLRALDVEQIAHAKGNARAKGSVEGGNNTVETKFECRLRFNPVDNVEQLNAYAEMWSIAYNGNLLPDVDTRLRREGLPEPVSRTDLWLTITQDQLRILPDIEACRATLEGAKTTRKVRNLKITYKHPKSDCSRTYVLSGLDGVCDGDTVEVSPLLFGECTIIVRFERYDGEAIEHRVDPVAEYDSLGFRASNPVFGESYAAAPDTEASRAAKELDRRMFPGESLDDIKKLKDKGATPRMGIDTLDHLRDIAVPTYIPKRGVDLPIAAAPEVAPMPLMRAIGLISKRLGRAISTEENQAIRADFPNGMTEDQIETWLAGSEQRPQLRAVGAQ